MTVTQVSAELMTLDAEGDEPVTLRVDCREAPLSPALTLMDVIELMGVPVRALCLGQVAGADPGGSSAPPGTGAGSHGQFCSRSPTVALTHGRSHP